MDTAPEGWARPEQYARHIDSSRATVYELLAQGMPSIKLGRSRRINVAAADAWIAERFAIGQEVAS